MSLDRRTFLRRALAAGLAGPLTGGCREAPPSGDGARRAAPARPLVRAWSRDAVHLVAPLAERPVAYLSVGERRVYVDQSRRDRAERLLGAYISITTGVWRIPLLGDDPRVPITPGDAEREFEEVDLARWDPASLPGEGDVRLPPGDLRAVDVELRCAPVLGGGGWVSARPFRVARFGGGVGAAGGGGREYFGEVARGRRHAGAACGDAGEPVRILTWGTRESLLGGFTPQG